MASRLRPVHRITRPLDGAPLPRVLRRELVPEHAEVRPHLAAGVDVADELLEGGGAPPVPVVPAPPRSACTPRPPYRRAAPARRSPRRRGPPRLSCLPGWCRCPRRLPRPPNRPVPPRRSCPHRPRFPPRQPCRSRRRCRRLRLRLCRSQTRQFPTIRRQRPRFLGRRPRRRSRRADKTQEATRSARRQTCEGERSPGTSESRDPPVVRNRPPKPTLDSELSARARVCHEIGCRHGPDDLSHWETTDRPAVAALRATGPIKRQCRAAVRVCGARAPARRCSDRLGPHDRPAPYRASPRPRLATRIAGAPVAVRRRRRARAAVNLAPRLRTWLAHRER